MTAEAKCKSRPREHTPPHPFRQWSVSERLDSRNHVSDATAPATYRPVLIYQPHVISYIIPQRAWIRQLAMGFCLLSPTSQALQGP